MLYQTADGGGALLRNIALALWSLFYFLGSIARMTRQQERVGEQRRRMLLDVRELAHGESSTQKVVAAFGTQRVAVLVHSSPPVVAADDQDPSSSSNPSSVVRLGVVKNTVVADASSGPVGSTAPGTEESAPVWVDLWTKDEAGEAATAGENVETAGETLATTTTTSEQPKWSLVWSPDGEYLVVSGVIVNREGKLDACMWVYTCSEWMGIADGKKAEATPPLLIRVHPRIYLPAKEWKKAAASPTLVASPQIVSTFFQKKKGNRLFFLSDEGLLVKMEVQVPKIALLSVNDAPATEADTKGLFQMQIVKRVADWHAGVTAASFEPTSATLVISGGLKNPSEELIKSRASSLSVWKMLESDPFCDLLDYTMVLGEDRSTVASDSATGEQESVVASAAIASNSSSAGLPTPAKSSIFSPFKFLMGGTAEAQVVSGFIRQLAISPDGIFVSMLDDQGRFSIRQIDTCSDVLGWQFMDASVSSWRVSVADLLERVGVPVRSVFWVSAGVLGFVLENRRVVYGELKRQQDFYQETSNPVGGDSQAAVGDAITPDTSSAAIEIISARYHIRGSPALQERDWMADAVDAITNGNDVDDVATYQLVSMDGSWSVNFVQNVELSAFVQLLMASHRFDQALEVVEAHGMTGVINLDAIHRQIWTQFRDAVTIETIENHSLLATEHVCLGTGFSKALHHLHLIQDKHWVVDQCLRAIASDSFVDMKEILGAGLRALMTIAEGVEGDQDTVELKQQTLLRSIYRLDTLKLVLAEELETGDLANDEDPTRVAEQYYDGTVFTHFRSASIVEMAKQLAREGRVGSLTVLFRRNAWNIIPHRLEILSLLPASIPPSVYAHLLPAIGFHSTEEWQFYALRRSSDLPQLEGDTDSRGTRVAEVGLDLENKSHDLDAADYALFEVKARQSDEERREEYARWFRNRILDLDSLFGQLAHAYQLSNLATECLSGWVDCDSKAAFDAFQQHVERLYSCIYPLQLSTCCLLSLQEWSTFTLHDQILSVIGDWDSVSDAIDRIQAVFVAQRGGSLYALDDALSLLCRTLSEKSSLSALEFCAQLIHHSNPSMPIFERWIQNDALLLRTSIDVVMAATTSGYINKAEDLNAQHGVFVEQLWVIFQSLPIRKEDDPPEIEQLQVEVDEMEDLMVTMDVLSKYGVHSSPSELKGQLGEAGAAADDLLQRMCQFCLPGDDSDSASTSDDEKRWMAVWQDATKLKTHVFGERISQEAILDVILRHLLTYDIYLDAAAHLVTNWIGSNHEVIHHVVVVLIRAVQTQVDTLRGNFTAESDLRAHFAAVKCMDIAQHVLSFPSLEREPSRKTQYERQLRHEKELIHACQLLDLLTYGAVKLSPANIRPLKNAKDRLEVVLQVFTSNPSHYQPSNRAREWLRAHHQEQTPSTEPHSKPLEAVLYLAKLLRVDDHKHQITMKGAYAALYCADYDVAYGLTTEVIQDIQVGFGESERSQRSRDEDVELQHLMSLVLDLISASSFRSWSKKIKLCRLVFSAASVAPMNMFGHQITNLVMSWMEKLEAVEALATELGLSEGDLEERRAQESNAKSSVEDLLLKELEIVIDLLQEEKNDRSFLLRLLQKGFQLVYVVVTSAVAQRCDGEESRIDGKLGEENRRAGKIVQQMTRICFEEAIKVSSSSSGDLDGSYTSNWREYLEMGFSYLLLWSDFAVDECDIEAFWEQDISPLLSASQPASSSSSAPNQGNETILRQIHHFFMLQVASTMQVNDEADDRIDLSQQLQERRRRIEAFARSYEETKRFVVLKNLEPEAEEDDELGDASGTVGSMTSKPALFKEKRDVFLRLAKRCQEKMLSQKQTQELEEMNSFFNENLDLEEFSRDSEYRTSKILMLATKKEHYQAAKQFAGKYGVDEYQCLLAYIRSVFLPAATGSSASALTRHEQLEAAFRSENEDFLEQALKKPFVFGHFLLNNDGNSVYESLDGTDHVGVLLLLRMVLECSKRIGQESSEPLAEERVEASLFPLSKTSSDRITLLFMCLKRLKEVDPLDQHQVVDFKLVCAANSCADLLTPPSLNAKESRKIAVEAILPFLNGKTIKMLTKILQKLHHVSTSAVVLIYLSDMLEKIWLEQRDRSSGLSGDLATYAYESCTPFLSVLSNDHLMLFHCLFLGRSWDVLEMDLDEEFYGQQLGGISHFGAFLTTEKRMELISDVLTLFQTRLEVFKASQPNSTAPSDHADVLASRENEVRFLESELVEAAFWFVADEVKKNRVFFSFDGESECNIQGESPTWQNWEVSIKQWFAKDDAAHKTQEHQELVDLLVPLCEQVSSVEIASLMVELVLHASSSIASVAKTLEALYRKVFSNAVAQTLSEDQDEWLSTIAREWAIAFPESHSKVSKQMHRTARIVETLCSSKSEDKSTPTTYRRILAHLDQSPSAILKEMVDSRKRVLQQQSKSEDNSEGKTFEASVAHAAVIAEWRHVLELWDREQKWSRSAILSRLVLDGDSKGIAKQDLQAYEREYFGLRAKAVFGWLHVRSEGVLDLEFVIGMATEQMHENFDAVFSHALAILESKKSSGGLLRSHLQELTFAVAMVLFYYDEVLKKGGISEQESRKHARWIWEEEQQEALKTRIQDQFSIGIHDTAEPGSPVTSEQSEEKDQRNWWSTLLLHGEWDDRQLMKWYLEMGYGKIHSAHVVEEYVVAHWEVQKSTCLQLLLVSPFGELRTRHQDRVLSSVRDQTPRAGRSSSQLVELLLLRFDVHVLLQAGLYPNLLHLHLDDDVSGKSRLWTSSGEFLVCALVMMKEYATAARLVCALWQVHPLLWDFENARLALANYLKALATAYLPSASDAADYEDAILHHQVYGRAFNFFQREMTM